MLSNLLFFCTLLSGKHAYFLFLTTYPSICLSLTCHYFILYIFYVFLLQTKEMCEAATHQIKAELRHGKKETKVLLKEAQQEYDGQSAYYFCFFIS